MSFLKDFFSALGTRQDGDDIEINSADAKTLEELNKKSKRITDLEDSLSGSDSKKGGSGSNIVAKVEEPPKPQNSKHKEESHREEEEMER